MFEVRPDGVVVADYIVAAADRLVRCWVVDDGDDYDVDGEVQAGSLLHSNTEDVAGYHPDDNGTSVAAAGQLPSAVDTVPASVAVEASPGVSRAEAPPLAGVAAVAVGVASHTDGFSAVGFPVVAWPSPSPFPASPAPTSPSRPVQLLDDAVPFSPCAISLLPGGLSVPASSWLDDTSLPAAVGIVDIVVVVAAVAAAVFVAAAVAVAVVVAAFELEAHD